MNRNIKHLLEAIASLEQISRESVDCSLEITSLYHKLQGIYLQGKEGLEGKALIDAMTDEELQAAVLARDPKIGLHHGRMIDPFIFNYIRHNRCVRFD